MTQDLLRIPVDSGSVYVSDAAINCLAEDPDSLLDPDGAFPNRSRAKTEDRDFLICPAKNSLGQGGSWLGRTLLRNSNGKSSTQPCYLF